MNAFIVLIFGIRFYKHVIMLYMYAKFYRAGSFKFIITFWWVVVERLNLVITYYSILSNETLYYDRAYTVSAISGVVGIGNGGPKDGLPYLNSPGFRVVHFMQLPEYRTGTFQ